MVGNRITDIRGSANTAVRNIASGCQGPGQNGAGLTNGTNPQINTRTSHYNESGIDLYNLAVCYSGWISKNPAFVNCTDSYTVTASIEYPSGTFTQITWKGTSSALIAPGANVASDMVGVFIPKNAHFWVRTYGVASGTGTLPISDIVTAANGELGEQAASGLADKTLGGTITGSVSTLRPSAILSRVPANLQSWAGIGDSLMCGVPGDVQGNVPIYDAHGNIGCFGRAFSGKLPFINIATGGTAVTNNSTASVLAGPLGLLKLAGITDVLTDWGVNDLNLGFSVASITIAYVNLYALFANNGQRSHQTTITPATTSTNHWIDQAGQTFATGGGAFTGGAGSKRALLCNNIRALPGTLHAFIEVAWALDPTDSGYWPSGGAFNSGLLNIDTLTVTGSPTTTSIPSNATEPDGYYSGVGFIKFTSGVNSGVQKTVATYVLSGGTFTVSALASAPSAGDTFLAYPYGCQCTDDGFHPWRIPNGGALNGVAGGNLVILPYIQSYLASLNPTQGTGGAGTIAGGDTPLTVSGCKLWLQADDLPTVLEVNNTNVITWHDKSGNGNHAYQWTNGLQPKSGQNVINNRNALKVATGQGFNLPSPLYTIPTGDNTIFIVCASANSGDAIQNVLAGFIAGPALRYAVQLTATALNVENRSSSSSLTAQSHTLDTSTICIGFNCQVGGNNIQPFINGVKGTPGTNVEAVTLTSLVISGNPTLSANRFNGSGTDVLIYNKSLSIAEMNRVGQLLAALRGFVWTNW